MGVHQGALSRAAEERHARIHGLGAGQHFPCPRATAGTGAPVRVEIGPQGPANGPNGRRKRPQNPKNGVFRVRAGNFEGLFSVAQSIVVAPRAAEDAQRMAGLGALNHLGAATSAHGALSAESLVGVILQAAGASAAPADGRLDVGGGKSTRTQKSAARQQNCPTCRAPHADADAFCESCGTSLSLG